MEMNASNGGVAPKGRYAPSPTGRMHLGNVFAALVSWLSVKSQGGRWVLRMEDLDPQRCRREWAELIEDDLHWLGLEWDEGGLEGLGPDGPYCQSDASALYAEALERLEAKGMTYRCRCTRADILATQAPHESDGRVVYGGTCRGKGYATGSVRLEVPDREIRFTDRLYGPQSVNLARHCGDFIVRRADGAWAYQLAVVVDDARMGITEVVRGSDLLLSSAQQIHLYKLLGRPVPRFAHVPLLCNAQGQRLSKRDGSLSMEVLRREASPREILGRLAWMAGLSDSPGPVSLAELTERFSWDKLRAVERLEVRGER